MGQIIDAEIRLKDRLSEKLKNVRSNLAQSTKVVDRFGKSVRRVGRKIEKFGANFSKKVSAPVLGLGTASLVASSNFEQGMLKIKNVTQATSEQLETFKQKALELSLRSTKAPAEIAEGMSFLGLAGWTDNQILENFEPILRASESSGLDLKTMSDLVTDSLSAFGLAAEDTSDFLNKLAKASIKANTDVGQALEGILGSGGMAKQLGLTVEEYGATLGVLANRGIKASDVGTALNSIFINLLGTTTTTKKALDELNVTVYDAQGNFVGWENLLESLSSSMEGLTDEQRNLFSAMLGGKTQLDTLLALLSGYREEYKDLKKEIGDIYVFDEAGNKLKLLDKMADDQLSTTAGRFAQFKNSVTIALIELGDAVAPVVLPMLENVTSSIQTLTDKWESLGEDGQKDIVKIAGSLALFGVGVALIGKMVIGLGNFISSIKVIWPVLLSLFSGPVGMVAAMLGLVYGFREQIKAILTDCINSIISCINTVIRLINKIPGVSIPEIKEFSGFFSSKHKEISSKTLKADYAGNISSGIGMRANNIGVIGPKEPVNGKILNIHTRNLIPDSAKQNKTNNVNINISNAEFKNDIDAERLAKIINDKLQKDMHNIA